MGSNIMVDNSKHIMLRRKFNNALIGNIGRQNDGCTMGRNPLFLAEFSHLPNSSFD